MPGVVYIKHFHFSLIAFQVTRQDTGGRNHSQAGGTFSSSCEEAGWGFLSSPVYAVKNTDMLCSQCRQLLHENISNAWRLEADRATRLNEIQPWIKEKKCGRWSAAGAFISHLLGNVDGNINMCRMSFLKKKKGFKSNIWWLPKRKSAEKILTPFID